MIDSEYGEKYKDHLLEEYKLFVQMTDNVSARRSQANQFYVTVLSALLAIVTAVSQIFGKGEPAGFQTIAYMALTLLGIVICGIWFVNIESYKQLNSGKFQVIHQMEQQLPFACYAVEWKALGEGREMQKYFPLTHIERYVPMLMAVPFFVVFTALCTSL